MERGWEGVNGSSNLNFEAIWCSSSHVRFYYYYPSQPLGSSFQIASPILLAPHSRTIAPNAFKIEI
jgi:hypothetical protein